MSLVMLSSACGNNPQVNSRQMTLEEKITELRPSCLQHCFRLMDCYKEVCDEDHPNLVTEFEYSVFQQTCITRLCETEGYLELHESDQEYLECTQNAACRDVWTNACGDYLYYCSERDPTSGLKGFTPPPREE